MDCFVAGAPRNDEEATARCAIPAAAVRAPSHSSKVASAARHAR
jgi:hypothetical protein